MWVKKNSNNTYSFSRGVPDNKGGYKECNDNSPIYKDYKKWSDKRDLDENELDIKKQKIDLKARIDAGGSLGLDMTDEQAELDNLMGV